MNKTLLITGTSSEIAQSIITMFAKEKYNIITTYKTNKKKSQDFVKQIKKEYQIDIKLYHLDITKEQNIKQLYKKISKQNKNIDILINNAAIDMYINPLEITKKTYNNILNTNLIGPYLMIKHYEKNNNKGTIINISSTDGINTYNPYRISYCASKSALINMTENLSLYLKNKIYTISPNWVETTSVNEINPNELKEELNRIGQKKLIKKEEISKEILKLIKKEKKTGSNIIIKGE